MELVPKFERLVKLSSWESSSFPHATHVTRSRYAVLSGVVSSSCSCWSCSSLIILLDFLPLHPHPALKRLVCACQSSLHTILALTLTLPSRLPSSPSYSLFAFPTFARMASQFDVHSSHVADANQSPTNQKRSLRDSNQDDDDNTTPPTKTLKHTTIDDHVNMPDDTSDTISKPISPATALNDTKSTSTSPEPTLLDSSHTTTGTVSPKKKKRGREVEDDDAKSSPNDTQELTVKRPRDASTARDVQPEDHVHVSIQKLYLYYCYSTSI